VRDVTEVTECVAGAAQLSFEIMSRAKDSRLGRARCKRCEREAEHYGQNAGLSDQFHNNLHELRTALQYPWFISLPQPGRGTSVRLASPDRNSFSIPTPQELKYLQAMV
jgi:hypothetical protein